MKTMDTSLLLLVYVLITLVFQSHAHYSLGKEKVTNLHFYFRETSKGDHPSTLLVAQPKGANANDTNLVPFGSVYVKDDLLTEGLDPNSKVVGYAQGLSVSAGQDKTMIVFVVDLGFTSGEFNGSSLSVFSRNPIFETDRELAIVGGRGKFRMAKGFANLHTYTLNATTGVVVVEYNVTVFHYE